MAAKFPFASSFTLKKAFIYGVKSEKALDITDLIIRFDYFENIRYPAISGRLRLLDNGANLISSLPIQGFEKIEIEVETSDEVTHEYNFRVYKIDQRFAGDRFQTYTLGLISIEGLLNEGVRIPKTLSGKAEEIVEDLLKTYLKTDKEIFVDSSSYDIKFNPGKKSPFSIINSIQAKIIPEGGSSTTPPPKENAKNNRSSEEDSDSLIPKTDSGSYGKSKGTGGYLFFENKKGYNFRSIDGLCSEDQYNGKPAVAKYVQENNDVGGPPERKILDIDFVNEIDIMSKLRMGAFSSLISYYNFSTGSYEEYTYSLAESYENMGHMGSQKGLPYGQKKLSEFPTRIMSVLMDDETWFNDKKIGSIEEKHNGGEGGAPFPDFQKYYIAQSISRINSLSNQKVKITITGNPSLMVGDKIEIEIPNQIPTKYRTEEPYDPEHSGVYLISELNHAFSPKDDVCTTFLTLIRDSYGKKDTSSKVQ